MRKLDINYKRSELVVQDEIYCQALSSRQRMFYARTNGVHKLSTSQTNYVFLFLMHFSLKFLDSDPNCICAQELSQFSFGFTFLTGSTVVMINLILYVHLRWSNYHLDFLFDAKEFLNCSLRKEREH